MKLVTHHRSSKLRTVGFLLLMFSSVFIGYNFVFLHSIYKQYKEPFVTGISFSIDASDLHSITGEASMTFQNFLKIPVYIHSITSFFVFKESIPTQAGLFSPPVNRIFGSAHSSLNTEIKDERISIKAKGDLNFASVQNLCYVIQGMALENLKNNLEYHIYLDISVEIFSIKFRFIRPLIKIKKFVSSPLIILPRLYTSDKKIKQFNYSDLTKAEKNKIVSITKSSEILFLEDLDASWKPFQLALNAKYLFLTKWFRNYLNTIFTLKVLIAYKFYHINLCLNNLPVLANLYSTDDYTIFEDNSSLTKFRILSKLPVKASAPIFVQTMMSAGLENTKPDAYSGEDFNNRLLSIIKVQGNEARNNAVSVLIAHLSRWDKLKKLSLSVGIDRNKNRFNSNLDYNNLIVQSMGVLVFNIYPPDDAGNQRAKKYIRGSNEKEWIGNEVDK